MISRANFNDYKEGLTIGTSARQRAANVHAIANPGVQASDFVRPGRVFPLVAKAGGVLIRSGYGEAAVDPVRLAGLIAHRQQRETA